MRASQVAVVAAPRRIDIATRSFDGPAPGRVRIAVAGCGICGSNLPVWEGRPWFSYPLSPGAPGHEAWGRVDAVGDGVTSCRIGDPVAFLGEDAFAEHIDVPAEHVVVLPPELADTPFPGEALGCGFNIAARSGFAEGQTVAVVGVGFLGAVVTAIATRAGARVLAVSRRPFALEIGTAMGAKETIPLDVDVAQRVGELTGGDMCDVVVEAVGSQGALDLAGNLGGVRSRLVIAGFHQDGQRTVDIQGWNWRGIDVVNAHERHDEVRLRGIREAAEAVAAGWFDPSPLYTHAVPLERLGDGLDGMVERPDGFLKALMVL